MVKVGVLPASIAGALGCDDRRHSKPLTPLLMALSLGGLMACATTAHAAFYIVDTTGDPGPTGSTSLREAVIAAAASAGNVVKFDASLVGSTITLAQGAITTNSPNDFAIQGRGSTAITISANNASGIFIFAYSAGHFDSRRPNVTISGVSLVRGRRGNLGGGAISAFQANVVLNDVTIAGCTSSTIGGAIALLGGSLAMSNSRISGSVAQKKGGAIYAEYVFGTNPSPPSVKISNSTISGNDAAEGGGAVYVLQAGSVSLYDSTLSGNTTYGYGAGLAVGKSGAVRIERSSISGNYSKAPRSDADVQGGGGIALKQVYGQSIIRNSTITGNSAYSGSGGGIGIFDPGSANRTLIDFCTITANYAGYLFSGNGVHAAGSTHVSNSIIAGNFNRGNNLDLSSGTFLAHHNLIQNAGSAAVSGSGNIFGQDPKLGPLRDNGGPAPSQLPAAASPVIDKADSGNSVVTDQRGYARPAGGGKDMGAVERQSPEDLIFRNGFDSS